MHTNMSSVTPSVWCITRTPQPRGIDQSTSTSPSKYGSSKADPSNVRPRPLRTVLCEPCQPRAAFHPDPAHRRFLAKDPFGLVLGDRDEAERHVGGHRELHHSDLLAVDIDELAEHPYGCVADSSQHAHASNTSSVRGCTPTAFAYCGGSGSGSTILQAMPGEPVLFAAVNPMGPAPAMRTSVRAGMATSWLCCGHEHRCSDW
jgi:hypothetical protein